MSGMNVLFVICVLVLYNVLHPAVLGTPTFSFPSLASLTGFSGFNVKRDVEHKEPAEHVKPYSGIRVRNDSLRMVYYHDQTIAIAEIGPGKLLLNCELIEVIEPEIAVRTLQKLSDISRPLTITLDEMLTLMKQCQMIDEPVPPNSGSNQVTPAGRRNGVSPDSTQPGAASAAVSTTRPGFLGPLSVFSGIVPGTKWCGTGDIADTYHDLGVEQTVDKCCRTHDICPVKIGGSRQRYNLTNPAIYTKSYCLCDDMLYNCLKESNSTTGQILGNIYFNIVQIPCIDDKNGRRYFRKSKNNF